MAFEKGNKLGKGRPVGKLNRSTEQAKLAISRLANSGLDALKTDLELIRKQNPIEAAKIYLKLLEYIVPKKSSVEIQGDISHHIEKVVIEIKNKDGKGTPHRDNKDL